MGENDVKIFAAFVNDGGEADDFRTRADDDEQLELAIVFKGYRVVVRFHGCRFFSRRFCRYPQVLLFQIVYDAVNVFSDIFRVEIY